MICPKCGSQSGDDWSQCEGSCPIVGSPHFDNKLRTLPFFDEKTGRAILRRDALTHGDYYVGRCRNASIARWSEIDECFTHWRTKWDSIFVERINHPVDDINYDVFRVVRRLEIPLFYIPLPSDELVKFAGDRADLGRYHSEMWRRT